MASANFAHLLSEAWDQVASLSAYGHDEMTVGWHKGDAFVLIWNFRTDNTEWRRLPSHDGRQPATPPKRDPFNTSYLYEKLFR